jgi:hypothetical protein
MSDLATLAERLRFPTLAKQLRGAKLPPPAANDTVLDKSIPTEPVPAMQLMLRRAHDPRLVELMRRVYADRPLERGLFAWDVLAGSIIESPELLATLRRDAIAVREVLPEPGERHSKLDRISSTELVDRMAVARFKDVSVEQLLEAAHRRDLGAMRELQKRGFDEKMVSTGFLRDSHRFAASIASMHCPTLSSFYLDFIWRGLYYRPALADLCETYLDFGAVDSLPADEEILSDGSDADIDLMAYVDGRRAVARNKTKDKLKQYEASPARLDYSKPPAELAKTFPRSQLVEAEIFTRWDKTRVPAEVVAAILQTNPDWRYAARVLLGMIARFSESGSPVPFNTLDSFVKAYGNDFRAWYNFADYGPEGDQFYLQIFARLVRELTLLPHDQPVWVMMAMMTGEAEDGPAVQEVYQRTEEQCRLD